jgi:hypothetical protein
MNPKNDLLPLASIPNKEGFELIAVRKDGAEARVAVTVDKDGNYTLPGWKNLAGWRRV